MEPWSEILARKAYETYCRAVGGVAFNGDPLPIWSTFAFDPAKAKQVAAWRKVGEMIERECVNHATVEMMNSLDGGSE